MSSSSSWPSSSLYHYSFDKDLYSVNGFLTSSRRNNTISPASGASSLTLRRCCSSSKNQIGQLLYSRLICDNQSSVIGDIVLVGNDGIEVPALRSVLACRSPVLNRMLYGDFEEAKSRRITLGGGSYSHVALRGLVEYCCTETIQVSITATEEGVRAAVQLMKCADCYGIEGLGYEANFAAKTLIRKHLHLACAVFDETTTSTASDGFSPSSSQEDDVVWLREKALRMIEKNPEEALLRTPTSGSQTNSFNYDSNNNNTKAANSYHNSSLANKNNETDGGSNAVVGGGIQSLDVASLRALLKSLRLKHHRGEMTTFRIVQKWSNVENGSSSNNNTDNIDGSTVTQDRVAAARELISQHIDLFYIEPRDLLQTVKKSGLVSPVKIAETFAQQAVHAAEQGILFSRPSSLNHNKRNNNNINTTKSTKRSSLTVASSFTSNAATADTAANNSTTASSEAVVGSHGVNNNSSSNNNSNNNNQKNRQNNNNSIHQNSSSSNSGSSSSSMGMLSFGTAAAGLVASLSGTSSSLRLSSPSRKRARQEEGHYDDAASRSKMSRPLNIWDDESSTSSSGGGSIDYI